MRASVKITCLSNIALTAAFVQLLVAGPTDAATNAQWPEKVSAQARATIVERLDRMQRSPVIVRLDTAQSGDQPRRDRRSAAFRAHKQQVIAARQTRVMERLGARRTDRRRYFRNLPFLALDLSPGELVALEAMPDMISVGPD